MNQYHVTYYYLATGMEGHADERDLGVYTAASKDEAMRHAMALFYPNERQNWDWIQGCLTAKRVA